MDSCNIKVAIKVRPLNHRELLDGRVYWKVESDSLVHVDPFSEKKNGDQFFFDRVFCCNSTNVDVFDDIVRPIIDRGVQGFNGTVFAYGQTASGKTYTMSGEQSNPGIIPLAINYMFDVMNSSASREFLLRACFMEIYNEKVIDLLEKKDITRKSRKIEIQKDGLHITPLKAIVCQNAQMVLDLMKIGEKNRSIGETNMNDRSSRSHTIFRIILESRNINDDCDGAYQQSVINLVDLAGSERSGQTQSSMERFKEGCKINSSLTTLGLVIQQLSECPDSSQHINFRDSKLTRILQTSLGGNSLTAIICTVTLAVDEQTHNTLSFASRAKKIKNTAKINENVTDETLLKRYRIQLTKLNEELEGIKQIQCENNEVNEIKYKYQEEKRTNEELKARIKRLQNNMITSSVGQRDQPSNKKGYNRRRTWGGKLDNMFSSSNSILETIEEDVNIPRPSVPSNFGNQNKEFKTPLEPFEWDLIREEGCTADNEFSNKENNEHDFSPPSGMPLVICETPKKVLRERINNYKNMFESSMKENNELREFTTLEKQMFHENSEQLKDLDNLRKQVEDLQGEKNELAKVIEKLKHSKDCFENEKRDIIVTMEMQNNKFETRENELLTTIQELKDELNSKEERLKKVMSNDKLITEKQDEINRLGIKLNEINQLNNTYVDKIENLKLQLLYKDQKLNEELVKHCSVLNEMSHHQNYLAEIKSIPCATQFLADEGYFTLKKCEIEELDKLLEHIYYIVEQLQQENQTLKDENNNLKLITNDFTETMNNVKRENDRLKSELNYIDANVRSTIKEFSASSEIDVDSSKLDVLIAFAVDNFEKNTIKIDELSNENINLKEEVSILNDNLVEIKSFMLNSLDNIHDGISVMEVKSSAEVKNIKKELIKTVEENLFLKSSIEVFNKLTFECVEIIDHVKVNQSNIMQLQDNFAVCSTMKHDFQVQIEEINRLSAELKTTIENKTKVEKEIREELENAFTKLDELQNDELKTNSNAVVDQLNVELQTIKSDLEDKSNLAIDLEEAKLELLTNYSELEQCYQSSVENLKHKEEIEKQLQNELFTKTNDLQKSVYEISEMKMKIELNESEINRLMTEIDINKVKLVENKNFVDQINELNALNSELKIKLEEKCISENKILEDLLNKTNELDNALAQLNDYQSTCEDMKVKIDANANSIIKLNSELDVVKCELLVKSKLLEEFENNKSEVMKYLEEIHELNNIIHNIKCELKEKLTEEEVLKNELQIVTVELDDAVCKVNNVKSVMDILNNQCASNICIVEQLKSDFESMKSTLDNKTRLIFELESTNSDLLTKCENSKVTDKLNQTIFELEIKLENKTKIENQLKDELKVKTTQLEDALVKENEVQSLIESMENEIKSNIDLIEQTQSELATKSNLLNEVKNMNSELLLKCSELENVKLTNYEQCCTNLQEQLQTIIEEKNLIEHELNSTSQNLLEMTKLNHETKTYLENQLQLQILNYQKLYEEFVSLSDDIESLIKNQINTEFNLREEILYKSTEIDDLQKQMHESSMDQYYSKLEEEYMSKSQECNVAQERIVNLETQLSAKEKTEIDLKNNLEAKCSALAEYKKNVEFLFSRNDSFQIRVNDFEDNVLVELSEEFDSMKSELTKKAQYEETLFEEKAKLERNLNELQEKLINVTKDLELSEERSEDLASTISVLVIEVKDANSNKEKLESHLKEAEHDLLKAEDLAKNFECELCILRGEFENVCTKADNIEKEFLSIESKFKDKMNEKYLEGCEVSKQLTDSLADYVHDIKLKLTELNSAIISGNRSEKKLRTKIMSAEDDIVPLDESWKGSSGSQSPDSPYIGKLQKEVEDKTDLVNTLQKTKNDMEKVINELQDQVKKLSDENNVLVFDITLIKNDFNEKTSLVNNLSNELSQFKKQYTELEEHHRSEKEQMEIDLREKILLVENLSDELSKVKTQYTELVEHNQVTKEQIHYSFDIDSELRNGKKNIVQEINLLEPGKITGVLTNHNLSNLLDTFVNLIMTKEQQIVSDLVNEQNKSKQQYEDQIKQHLEDIKKGKEWQEQVESDNEKLCLELENLKSQHYDFPSKDVEIKELTEKVLEAEVQSYTYLSELQELKTKVSKTSEQNYQLLSNEFEVFKASSEQSIQNLKKKVEDLTSKYNESLSMYKDQKSSRSTLESQIVKVQSERDCLKAILEKKDEDIKNLIDKVELKSKEYETLLEKNSHQKEELTKIHGKKVDELQLELNDKTQKMYCSEKLLKEATKNYELLVEENSLNLLKIKQLESCCDTLKNCEHLQKTIEDMKEEIEDLKRTNSNLDNECESMLVEFKNKDDKIIELLLQESELIQNVKLLTEERDILKNKCEQFKNVNNDVKKLNDEICDYEQNIYQLRKEKGQLIVQHEKELKLIKSELNEVHARNLELIDDYNKLTETAKNLEKSLKENIQQLNRCIVDKNAKISTLELFSKTNTDELKKKNHELEYIFKKARDENQMLRKECRHLKHVAYVKKADQSTQTVEEQSVVSCAIQMAGHKSMAKKISKLETDNVLMKTILHHRKSKIEELQKQLAERH